METDVHNVFWDWKRFRNLIYNPFLDLDDSVIVFWLCPLFKIHFFPRVHRLWCLVAFCCALNGSLWHSTVGPRRSTAPCGFQRLGARTMGPSQQRHVRFPERGMLEDWDSWNGLMSYYSILCQMKSEWISLIHEMSCNVMSYYEMVKWCDKWILWWIVLSRLNSE